MVAIVFPVFFLQHWPPGGSPMTTFQKTLELIRKHADMGHHKEAVVRCTLPVTTCTVERSFSELMLMKTALCSCMTTESITSPYTLRHPY